VWGAKATVKLGPPASSKKTLQQIQKEEEARKQRAAVSAATVIATAGATQNLSSGKRYADLASRVAPAQPAVPAVGGAWTTVGASGKTKTPGPAVPAIPGRSVSGTVATIAQQATPKPKQVVRSTTMGNVRPGQIDALEEFKKWAVKELGSHLNKGINGKLSLQTAD
jgi:PERQ amino acid-rich with GYF domain-containing protein